MASMDEKTFGFYADLLKNESGLIVTLEKIYLLESRLLPIAKKCGVDNLAELADKIASSRDRELIYDVVEAMTTNETSFFRDVRPFDNLEKVVLPYFVQNRAGTRRLRIWSAACSTGQEAYSIAMILKEWEAKLAGWQIEIVGTDLSEDVLDKATNGVYTQFEVQRGLAVQRLVKFFEQNGDQWQVKQELRNMVRFQKGNLLGDLSGLGAFDIVFCRNVLIYFDLETKGQILTKVNRLLPDDGILFLGGAETVLGVSEEFKLLPDSKGLYIKKDGTFKPVTEAAA